MRHTSLSSIMLLALLPGALIGCAQLGGSKSTTAKVRKSPEAHFDLARLAESDGNLERAREMYESIYKADSSNAEVSHRLGIVHARQGNYPAAKRYLTEAQNLNPSNVEILNDLGYACYLNGELNVAEESLQRALKVDPKSRRAANNLAMVMGGQGRFEESFQLFRQVNSEAEAHSNTAYLYAQAGHGKEALEHYSRALSLNPDNKSAAHAMVEIAQLQRRLEQERSNERTELARHAASLPTTTALAQNLPEQATKSEIDSAAHMHQLRTPSPAKPVGSSRTASPPTQVATSRPASIPQTVAATAAPTTFPKSTNRISNTNVVAQKVTSAKKSFVKPIEVNTVTTTPAGSLQHINAELKEQETLASEQAVLESPPEVTAEMFEDDVDDDESLEISLEPGSLQLPTNPLNESNAVEQETQEVSKAEFEPAELAPATRVNPSRGQGLPLAESVEKPERSALGFESRTTNSADATESPIAANPGSQQFDEPEIPAELLNPRRTVIPPPEPVAALPSVPQAVPIMEQRIATTGDEMVLTDYTAICDTSDQAILDLLQEMNSHDSARMKSAIRRLGDLGSRAACAEPAFRQSLTHVDMTVRLSAAIALFQINPSSEDVTPILLQGLQHADPSVRATTATLMQTLPPSDAFASALMLSLQDQNVFVRLHAAEALSKYPAHFDSAVRVVVTHMSGSEANTRYLATFIVGEMPARSESVIPALIQNLGDSDERVQGAAIYALGQCGPSAVSAIPNLSNLAENSNDELREAAKAAIAQIQQNSP